MCFLDFPQTLTDKKLFSFRNNSFEICNWHVSNIQNLTDRYRVLVDIFRVFTTLNLYFSPLRKQFNATTNLANGSLFINFTTNDDVEIPVKFAPGVLAYCYGNQIYIDVEIYRKNPNYDIFNILLHEVGHSLGIPHTTDQRDSQDIMYPYYTKTNGITNYFIEYIGKLHGNKRSSKQLFKLFNLSPKFNEL